jgi:hypothetical protein
MSVVVAGPLVTAFGGVSKCRMSLMQLPGNTHVLADAQNTEDKFFVDLS